MKKKDPTYWRAEWFTRSADGTLVYDKNERRTKAQLRHKRGAVATQERQYVVSELITGFRVAHEVRGKGSSSTNWQETEQEYYRQQRAVRERAADELASDKAARAADVLAVRLGNVEWGSVEMLGVLADALKEYRKAGKLTQGGRHVEEEAQAKA